MSCSSSNKLPRIAVFCGHLVYVFRCLDILYSLKITFIYLSLIRAKVPIEVLGLGI